MRAAQRVEISGVALLIRHSIARASFFALAEAEMLARHPGVFQGFAERDRDDILSRLQTSLAYLRAQTGVEVLQFHRADYRNLVRLQDIARHGDDVSKRRPIVVAAIRSGRSQLGLELGPSGALLRGTAPVMRGRVLLGFIEVGLSVNPLLPFVKQATGAEVDQLGRHARCLGDRAAARFSGRMIGSAVGAANVDGATRAFNRDVLVLCSASVTGIVVAFSALRVAMMGFLVRPMEAMAAHAERLAAGGAASPCRLPEAGQGRTAATSRLWAMLLVLLGSALASSFAVAQQAQGPAGPPPLPAGVELPMNVRFSRIWQPAIAIENMIGQPRAQTVALSVFHDGRVVLIRRLDAEFRVDLAMAACPFDQQRLVLRFASQRHPAAKVALLTTEFDMQFSGAAEQSLGGQLGRGFLELQPGKLLRLECPALCPAGGSRHGGAAMAALSFTFESSFQGAISLNSPIAMKILLGCFYLPFVFLTDAMLTSQDSALARRDPALMAEMPRNVRWNVPMLFFGFCLLLVLAANRAVRIV